MADDIKVNSEPTPIQRNERDVAMELTQLYYKTRYAEDYTIEKIKETYLEFYSMVKAVEHKVYGKSFNPTVEKFAKNIISGE